MVIEFNIELLNSIQHMYLSDLIGIFTITEFKQIVTDTVLTNH